MAGESIDSVGVVIELLDMPRLFSTGKTLGEFSLPCAACATVRRVVSKATKLWSSNVTSLLKLALGIDWLSERLGRVAAFTVLATALISAGNAFIRYGLDISSNGWLEIQWYLFAACVMLGAPVVLKLNEHVRVDIIYGKLKGNGPVYVDLFGLLFFLLPVMMLLTYLSWPLFMKMYLTHEMSQNAGGLVRWPAMLMLPMGFGLMSLQGCAEIIKRICYLQGSYQMSTHYEKPVQ
jgi:TRAP-type mannitol/chloroaromatic compound transport system permease small subunit